MIPLKIGRTRSSFFTKVQKNKIEAGIDIFNKAIKSKYFVDEILKFKWSNQKGKRFHRFYHANGLSNQQIVDRIQNFSNHLEEIGLNKQLVILPCQSRKEIQNYNLVSNPIIWISLNCIQHDWFTSIHIASSICHELLIHLGFDISRANISNPDFMKFTSPHFCGHLILKTARKWEESISDIREAFTFIQEDSYNYFPASAIFSLNTAEALNNYQINFDNLISTLLQEQESLFALNENMTVSEKKRLICIEESLIQLEVLRSSLASCSLDGSETEFKKETNIRATSRS